MASSFLYKKKSITALLPSENISSVIRDIKSVKEILSSKSTKDKNRKRDKEITYDEILYEIFFDVDMRKIINNNISSVEYSLLFKKPIKNLSFFQGMKKSTPMGIASRLYGQREDNIREIKESQRQAEFARGVIDLNKEISGIKISDAYSKRKVSDKKLFGKVRYLKSEKSGFLIKKGKGEMRLSQMQFPTVEASDSFSNNRYNEYIMSINNGIDPASLFLGVENVVRVSPNNFSKKVVKIHTDKSYSRKSISNIARSKIEEIRSPPPTRVSELTNDTVISVISEKVDRIRTVGYRFRIASTIIPNVSNFIVRLKIRDPKTKLVVQSLDIAVPHKINKENYYIPEDVPLIKIGRCHPSNGSTEAVANLWNVGRKVSDLKVFVRRVSNTSNISSCYFSESPVTGDKAHLLQPGYKVKLGKWINKEEFMSARVTAVTHTGLSLSNFNTDSLKGTGFYYISSPFYVTNDDDGLTVRYQVNTDNIAGCIPVRKKPSDIHYVPVNYIKYNDNPEQIIARGALPICAGYGGEGNIADFSIDDGDLLSYRLKLFLKNGGSILSPNHFFAKRIKPLKYMSISIANLTTSTPGKQSAGYRAKGESASLSSPVAVKFTVDFNVNETSTDLLLEELRKLGNESIFSRDISMIKDTLSDIVLFGITRINITTGEAEDMGYHISGEFSDDGKYGSMPTIGNSYTYRVRAYLTTPSIVSDLYTISVNTNTNIVKQSKDIKIPSTIEKLKNTNIVAGTVTTSDGIRLSEALSTQTVENFQTIKLQRNFSKSALLKGVIKKVDTIEQNYDISDYDTGDEKYIKVNLRETNIGIKTSTYSVTRSSTGIPVLRFNIYAGKMSSLSMVDYIIISCVRNGQTSICGVCHNDRTGKIVFVDYINKEYIGEISYFASIVLLDGEKLKSVFLCTTFLRELFQQTKKIEG